MKDKHYKRAAAITASTILTTLACGVALAGPGGADWGPASPLLGTGDVQVPGGCPIESPGGRFIFTARRPGGPGTQLDIFVNERAAIDAPFASGNALPDPVNDPVASDFCPTPLPDGELLFVSTRGETCGGTGFSDMAAAVQNPATGWNDPVYLACDPAGPNTPGTEFSPALIKNKHGTFLFFSTDWYSGNQDIYYSRMRDDGTFGPGVALPWPINTQYDDRQPNVSQDGTRLVYASNRRTAESGAPNFDIMYVKRGSFKANWGKVVNLSESVPFDTLDASETRPSMSWDGKRLVYGSGGVWISDSTRKK